MRVAFEGGDEASFALVVADGVHSRVRELAFGPERSFARYLGLRWRAFSRRSPRRSGAASSCTRSATGSPSSTPSPPRGWTRPTSSGRATWATSPGRSGCPCCGGGYAGAGWIAERVLRDLPDGLPLFFDSLTQIVMPRWSAGRVSLIRDACGCLTLLAGQGSHMAMAGATCWRRNSAGTAIPPPALAAYERVFKPHVDRKQRQAAWLAGRFVPSARSWTWLQPPGHPGDVQPAGHALNVLRTFGVRSVRNYR